MALGTTDISIDLVRNAIGESSNSVGVLCRSSNIKKWAKYRPFHWTKSGNEDTGFIDLLSNDNWQGPTISYQSINNKLPLLTGKWCGFHPYIVGLEVSADFVMIQNAYTGGLNGWQFLPPTGGAASPYRLGDFRQYEHTASTPFNDVHLDDSRYIFGYDVNITVRLDMSYRANVLHYDSFPALNSLYFGVLLKKNNDQYAEWMLFTDIDQWDETAGVSINLSRSLFSVGTYTVYPVLCSRSGMSGISWQGTFPIPIAVTIPDFMPKTFTLLESFYAFVVQAVDVAYPQAVADAYIILTDARTAGETVTITGITVFFDDLPDFPTNEGEYPAYVEGNVYAGKVKYYLASATRTQKQLTEKTDADKVIRFNNVMMLPLRDCYLHFRFTHNSMEYTYNQIIWSPDELTISDFYGDQIAYNLALAQWGSNGMLTKTQLAAVASIGTVFRGSAITDLRWIKYFKNITEIPAYAFYSCRSLGDCGTIDWPDGITTVGNSAFVWCGNFSTDYLPDSVSFIDDYAFDHCYKLDVVSLPSCLGVVGKYAFYDCESFKFTSLPNGLTSMGEYAFAYCDNLALTSLPEGITELVNRTFHTCPKLDLQYLPSSLTTIGNAVFKECSGLTLSRLPSSLNYLGNEAFVYCTSISSMVIPSGLSTLNMTVFAKCSSLKTVTLLRQTPPYLSDYVFAYCPLEHIYVPNESVAAYKAASGWSAYADIIEGIAQKTLSYIEFSTASATCSHDVYTLLNVTAYYSDGTTESLVSQTSFALTPDGALSGNIEFNLSSLGVKSIASATVTGTLTATYTYNGITKTDTMQLTALGQNNQ